MGRGKRRNTGSRGKNKKSCLHTHSSSLSLFLKEVEKRRSGGKDMTKKERKREPRQGEIELTTERKIERKN